MRACVRRGVAARRPLASLCVLRRGRPRGRGSGSQPARVTGSARGSHNGTTRHGASSRVCARASRGRRATLRRASTFDHAPTRARASGSRSLTSSTRAGRVGETRAKVYARAATFDNGATRAGRVEGDHEQHQALPLAATSAARRDSAASRAARELVMVGAVRCRTNAREASTLSVGVLAHARARHGVGAAEGVYTHRPVCVRPHRAAPSGTGASCSRRRPGGGPFTGPVNRRCAPRFRPRRPYRRTGPVKGAATPAPQAFPGEPPAPVAGLARATARRVAIASRG